MLVQCAEVHFTQICKRYFLRSEKYIPDPAHPGVDVSLHGSSGPVVTRYGEVAVSLFSSPRPSVVSDVSYSLSCPLF